jgi:hypothetical protein
MSFKFKNGTTDKPSPKEIYQVYYTAHPSLPGKHLCACGVITAQVLKKGYNNCSTHVLGKHGEEYVQQCQTALQETGGELTNYEGFAAVSDVARDYFKWIEMIVMLNRTYHSLSLREKWFVRI